MANTDNTTEFFDHQLQQDLFEEQYKDNVTKANDPETVLTRQKKNEDEFKKQALHEQIFNNLIEIAPQLQQGFGTSINEIFKFIAQTEVGPIPASELNKKPETLTGEIAKEIGHFSTMFIPVMGWTGRTTQLVPWMAKLGKNYPKLKVSSDAMMAGFATDFASYDPNTENLANIIAGSIESYPQAKKLIAEYLATSKDNSQIRNRFNNALIGMLVGVGFEGAFAGAGYMTKKSVSKLADYITTLKQEHPEAIKAFLKPLKNQRGAIDFKKPQFMEAEPEDFGDIPGNLLHKNKKDIDELELKRLEDTRLRNREEGVEEMLSGGYSRLKVVKDAKGKPKKDSNGNVIKQHVPFTKAELEAFDDTELAKHLKKHRSTLYNQVDLTDEELKKILTEGSEKIPYKPELKIPQGEELEKVAKKLIENDLIDLTLVEAINLERLNSSDQIKGVIGQMAEGLGAVMTHVKKGDKDNVLTQKIVKKQAKQIGADPNKLWKATKDLPAQMLAGRNLMMKSADYLVQLAETYKRTQDPQDLIKLRFHNLRHGAIQAQIMGATSNVARTLSHMRILANSKDARLGGVNALVELWGNAEVNETFADAVIKAHKKGYAQLNKISRLSPWAVTRTSVIGAYMNGLLSGPETFERNIFGNSIAMFESLIERKLAEKATKTAMNGGQVTDELVQPGETSSMLSSLFNTFKESGDLFWETFETGLPTSGVSKTDFFQHQMDLLEIDEETLAKLPPLVRGLHWLHKTSSPVSRSLMSADESMKFVNYRMEVNARAWRRAMKEAGDDNDYFNYLYNHYRNNPSEEVNDFAKNFAVANAFQTRATPKSMSDVFEELGENVGKGEYISAFGGGVMDTMATGVSFWQRIIEQYDITGIGKWLTPFVATPFQLLDRGLALTPKAQKASIIYRKALKGSPAERQLIEAKIDASRYIFLSFFIPALFSDNITGEEPRDYKVNKHSKEMLPRYSMRLPFSNTWHEYNQLDPLAIPLGVSANSAKMIRSMFHVGVDWLDDKYKDDNMKAIDNLWNSVNTFVFDNMELVGDRAYLKGIADVFKTVTSTADEEEFRKNLNRTGDNVLRIFPGFSYYSGLRKATTKVIDPYVKQTHSDNWGEVLLNKTASQIPGVSLLVKNKKGMLGEDMIGSSQASSEIWREHNQNLHTSFMSAMGTPARGIDMEPEPIYKALTQYNINTPHPSDVRFIEDVELDDTEISFLGEQYGKYNDETINQPLRTGTYFSTGMNDLERQIQLKSDLIKNMKYAKEDTMRSETFELEAKKEKLIEQERQRVESGIMEGESSDISRSRSFKGVME